MKSRMKSEDFVFRVEIGLFLKGIIEIFFKYLVLELLTSLL